MRSRTQSGLQLCYVAAPQPAHLVFREHPAVENTALLSCNTPNNSIAHHEVIFA
jgi:hypothetical protein